MSKRIVPLEVFEELYDCDHCGTEIEYSGVVLTMYPPLYRHRCPRCASVYDLRSIYRNRIYMHKNG